MNTMHRAHYHSAKRRLDASSPSPTQTLSGEVERSSSAIVRKLESAARATSSTWLGHERHVYCTQVLHAAVLQRAMPIVIDL